MTYFAEQLRAAAAEAAQQLRAAAIEPDAVAEYEPPRRRFIGTRAARMREIGRAWKLGALLVTDEGELLIAGETLRAHEPPPILGYTSESARERDALRHSAIRGGFTEGTTVHWATQPIDLDALDADSTPLAVRDGALVVRWSPRAPLSSAMPLQAYLAERVELAIAPDRGA
ncbi:hypothetical protein [Gulosibacter macacae]|uniref:hypothetical protein n=1 Tax=Gulosibacter macacae TaxID=2488791 RepID=UPI001F210E1A|nr:hypothetical protein [Gulosibacter macacae]